MVLVQSGSRGSWGGSLGRKNHNTTEYSSVKDKGKRRNERSPSSEEYWTRVGRWLRHHHYHEMEDQLMCMWGMFCDVVGMQYIADMKKEGEQGGFML